MPVDLSQIEASQKQTQADLKAVGDQIKTYAERTEKEIKASGEMQAETRGKVDELLLKQGELQARMQEAEQKLVNAGKQHEPEIQQSAGQLVAAKISEEGLTSSFRGSRRVEVPRAAITSAPNSGGALVAPERGGVILAPQRRLTIRDLVAPGTTNSNAYEYVRETGFTNNAAVVGEGMAKPYSDLKFELENANVRTIAHLFKGSRQILDDAAALQSFIDARARYGLLLAEEAQLLYGNGNTEDNYEVASPEQCTSVAMVPLGTPLLAGPGSSMACSQVRGQSASVVTNQLHRIKLPCRGLDLC